MLDTLKKILGQELRDYLVITFALFLYATGWAAFLLPYEITCGGMTGVSAIVFYATGIPTQNTYFVINAALLLFAIPVLGWRTCLKTIYGVFMVTFMLGVLQALFRGGDAELPRILGEGEQFMACIIGSAFCGTGLALCFLCKGTTGGTDIIAMVVNKYKNVSLGSMMFLCDAIIISSCYFIFHDWKRVVFGFVTMFVVSIIIDYVVSYAQQSVQFIIISKKYEEIYKSIISDVDRGATLIDATGCYSGEPVKIVLVMARRKQSNEIFSLIKQIDPHSFVSQSKTQGVFGEGFDRIKI